MWQNKTYNPCPASLWGEEKWAENGVGKVKRCGKQRRSLSSFWRPNSILITNCKDDNLKSGLTTASGSGKGWAQRAKSEMKVFYFLTMESVVFAPTSLASSGSLWGMQNHGLLATISGIPQVWFKTGPVLKGQQGLPWPLQASRSQNLPTRILRGYLEAWTVLRPVKHPDDLNNTMLSQVTSLKWF